MFVGGFAFADDGGSTPEWASLAPASLVLPEISLARHRGQARMTVSVVVQPDRAHRLTEVVAARGGARAGLHAADRP